MESETKPLIKQNKNMDVLDILKETLIIYFKNINFIIFTFFTSLPFFCVMVYFETLFQQILVQTPQIISSLPFREKYKLIHIETMVQQTLVQTPQKSLPFREKYPIQFISINDDGSFSYMNDVPSFTMDYLPVLIQLGFIYTVPLHLLEFCSQVLAMDLASKLSSQEDNTKMSLKHMFQNSIDISIIKGTFKTSLYTLALSSCLLIAFPWTMSNCFMFARTFWCYIFFGTICFVAIGKLLMVYLEWSAIMNMSIVVSVLDGIYGVGALRVSCFFSSGNQKRGLFFMLVFFVFGLCLRLICIYFECYKGGSGIFLQIGVLTVVNTLKWVSCVIYFNNCKERKLEKKVDEEMGKDKLESNS